MVARGRGLGCNKVLCRLRSKLVHGGSMTLKSPAQGDPLAVHLACRRRRNGEMPAYVAERLRDPVRRAILARTCLASGDTPLWPLNLDSAD